MQTFESNEPKNRVVVRLRTVSWFDGRALHVKRSLTFLKRLCSGYNFLEEDIKTDGATEIALRLTNLDECEDGVYEAVPCNVVRVWETGIADDWDYELVKVVK